jgi:hypothetical protein
MPVEGADVVAPLAARPRREIGQADVLTDRQEIRTILGASMRGAPSRRAPSSQGE